MLNIQDEHFLTNYGALIEYQAALNYSENLSQGDFLIDCNQYVIAKLHPQPQD